MFAMKVTATVLVVWFLGGVTAILPAKWIYDLRLRYLIIAAYVISGAAIAALWV
jgi:hypothetical protein